MSPEIKADLEFKLAQREQEIENIYEAALSLAPAFRDKFDFSDPKNYEELSEYAFKAGQAMWNQRCKMVKEALGKLTAEAEARSMKEAKEAGK